ncbi:MAG: DegT/DnrJ/EryC1/StrS family aminotransferase [Aigarchaeota archaeon]|nr:DegT/DnrJ/EryC1/StrS family aminotransferase [Candidatus Pelearchaeum maunauluense]
MSELALLGGEPTRIKPFPRWPLFGAEEERELLDALRSGYWSVGGAKLAVFEREFASFQHAKYGLACTSGSTALLIALKALGVKRGDHVIIPSYTFLATATAVIDAGAVPIFADIEPETYTLSAEDAENRITPKTRCIIPVHLAGCPADMSKILKLAAEYGLRVLEDAAQAHGAEWLSRRVGSIGDAGAFSFYQSKNMTAGEGGFITTNNEEIAELAWSYHNVGRDRRRGWYEHVRYGWNFRMTEFQAAVLLAQLRRLPKLMKKREENAKYLTHLLESIPGVEPLRRPNYVTSHAYHLFIFKYRREEFNGVGKERFVEALRAEGIPCSAGYKPLYSYGFLWDEILESAQTPRELILTNTEQASREEAVWIPQNVLLAEREELEDIARAIEKIRKNSRHLV